METIKIHVDSNKAKAIKQFLKAFGVAYEVEHPGESPYNPEFVKKVLERSKNAKEGNTVKINPKDLWGSLGLK